MFSENIAPKKNLFIVTQNYPYGSGEKTFVEPELSYLLDSNQFDITIISHAIESSQQTTKLKEGITLKWIKNKSLLKMPIRLIKYLFKYFISPDTRNERNDIRRRGGDIGKLIDSMLFYIRAQIFLEQLYLENIKLENAIVYTYWNNIETLALALYKSKEQNIMLISRIHGYDLYDERAVHGRQPFKKTIDDSLDKLFFIAQTGKEYYVGKMGNSHRYILSYLGTQNKSEFSELRKKQKRQKTFLMVSCSNIIPLKRIELIVKALGQIDNFDIKWIHFGDGFQKKEIEEKAKKSFRYKKNISCVFLGQTDNEKIMQFYESNYVDCFITTSQTEGCPVTIQEAMSYGIPIIGTAVGEIPLMINGNGYLLSENPKAEEVAKAIICMHELPEEKYNMFRWQSRQLWEKYFDGDKNYKEFVQKLVEL